ncbi:hypothetical protein AYI69_g3601 [Smittium culicis]|uniref:Uncharacterized protein n=1 Tax=Smittium culicis TaxID=133412 RepID=A0A1R1YJ92_9FUNG|nr:hypothetical protein AYI69_g3601 [Smittium culicis]
MRLHPQVQVFDVGYSVADPADFRGEGVLADQTGRDDSGLMLALFEVGVRKQKEDFAQLAFSEKVGQVLHRVHADNRDILVLAINNHFRLAGLLDLSFLVLVQILLLVVGLIALMQISVGRILIQLRCSLGADAGIQFVLDRPQRLDPLLHIVHQFGPDLHAQHQRVWVQGRQCYEQTAVPAPDIRKLNSLLFAAAVVSVCFCLLGQRHAQLYLAR